MLFDEERLDSRLLREKRFRMVEEQLRLRSIFDKRVLESMKKVPRHLFVDEKYVDIAYGDHPIPITKKDTMNTPYQAGLMMQALEMRPQHKTLVVGTGSGFQTALAAEVSTQVYSVELNKDLASEARQRFKEYGYNNIACTVPRSVGLPSKGPYDRILVTGTVKYVPKELLKQLDSRGVMIVPVANADSSQDILKVFFDGDELIARRIERCANITSINGQKMTAHKFAEIL